MTAATSPAELYRPHDWAADMWPLTKPVAFSDDWRKILEEDIKGILLDAKELA